MHTRNRLSNEAGTEKQIWPKKSGNNLGANLLALAQINFAAKLVRNLRLIFSFVFSAVFLTSHNFVFFLCVTSDAIISSNEEDVGTYMLKFHD